MKSVGVAVVVVVVAAAVTAVDVTAHHSPAAFDLRTQVTIQGRVARLDWTNPHVYIHVETRTATGESLTWLIETDPVPLLTRSGWRREQLAAGSTVTIRANPDRDRSRNHALLVSLALADGSVLTPRSSGSSASSVAQATSLAGRWNALRSFGRNEGPIVAVVPTARGKAAIDAFNMTMLPAARCEPFTPPFLTRLPYLTEIDVRSDAVVIRSEFFGVDRTVYMDGRGHPDRGPRTPQGHSIGRWDGDTLVVDTTRFADHRVGNQIDRRSEGLPSGARKHLVERFQLSDDKTRLFIDYTLEDPDYLVKPVNGRIEWDHAPNQPLLPFVCDPDQARRFIVR